MTYDVVTIGDVMKDIFVFPAEDEMEKPIEHEQIRRHVEGEKFLLFEFGDKITISDIHYDVGGAAGNVAAGLAKLGLKTSIVSCVGQDSEGEEILEKLKKAKVQVDHLEIKRGKKTSFSIIISYRAERSILVFHSFQPDDFTIPKNLETDWVYVGPLGENYRKLYAQVTGLASEKNINIALNPGSVQIQDGLVALAGLLRVSKVLFLNREEGQKLAGLNGIVSVKDITENLLKTGVETVVVTDGKDGAYAATKDEFLKIGAYPGNRVEVTGAGDSFASAFLTAYIKSEKLFQCLKWGVVNSASVIEKFGAQAGLLPATTIKRRINEYHWPAETLRFSR